MDLYTAAIKLDSGMAAALNNRALAYLKLGMAQQAEEDASRVLQVGSWMGVCWVLQVGCCRWGAAGGGLVAEGGKGGAAVGSRHYVCAPCHVVVPVKAATPGTGGLCKTGSSSCGGEQACGSRCNCSWCAAWQHTPYYVHTAAEGLLVHVCAHAPEEATCGPTMIHLQCSPQASTRPGLTWPLPCCPAAPQAEPSNVKALLRRSTAREALAQPQPAAEDLRAALALQPGNKEAQQGLARLEAGMAAMGGAEAAAGEGGKQ